MTENSSNLNFSEIRQQPECRETTDADAQNRGRSQRRRSPVSHSRSRSPSRSRGHRHRSRSRRSPSHHRRSCSRSVSESVFRSRERKHRQRRRLRSFEPSRSRSHSRSSSLIRSRSRSADSRKRSVEPLPAKEVKFDAYVNHVKYEFNEKVLKKVQQIEKLAKDARSLKDLDRIRRYCRSTLATVKHRQHMLSIGDTHGWSVVNFIEKKGLSSRLPSALKAKLDEALKYTARSSTFPGNSSQRKTSNLSAQQPFRQSGVFEGPSPQNRRESYHEKVMSKGPCFKCGAHGHWAPQCPLNHSQTQQSFIPGGQQFPPAAQPFQYPGYGPSQGNNSGPPQPQPLLNELRGQQNMFRRY